MMGNHMDKKTDSEMDIGTYGALIGCLLMLGYT